MFLSDNDSYPELDSLRRLCSNVATIVTPAREAEQTGLLVLLENRDLKPVPSGRPSPARSLIAHEVWREQSCLILHIYIYLSILKDIA